MSDGDELWRALANPSRRRLLDLLRTGPRTTGDLADQFPDLSRFAVMQHLDVLTDAGVVIVERRGRHRYNHLNPVPLRGWYERWVPPAADRDAESLLRLRRTLEPEGDLMDDERFRTVRIAAELRFRTSPEKLFHTLTQDTRSWFPHTYGGDRCEALVAEPRVGGAVYEDWGGGTGHLYGHVTVYDPPLRWASRGRIMPGTILDTDYTITADGDGCMLRASKVAAGPMTEGEAASIGTYGDLARFADAIRAVVEA
jgi:DNA-binding transcriptional ArsR family regulator